MNNLKNKQLKRKKNNNSIKKKIKLLRKKLFTKNNDINMSKVSALIMKAVRKKVFKLNTAIRKIKKLKKNITSKI